MIFYIRGLTVRSRPAAVALAAAALAVGAVLVAFGIVLLLGLTAVGAVVGAGVLLVRSVKGWGAERIRGPGGDRRLDPALEVFPVDRAAATSLPARKPTSSDAHEPA